MVKRRPTRQKNTCTVSNYPKDGEVDQSFPVGSLLQGDSISCRGKNVAAANSDQLTAIIAPRHIVEHSSIVYESIQFSVDTNKKKTL